MTFQNHKIEIYKITYLTPLELPFSLPLLPDDGLISLLLSRLRPNPPKLALLDILREIQRVI